MEKIAFKDDWDEMCPLFIKNMNSYEHIGTGVLINIWGKVYLLTVAHIVDFFYEKNKELYMPNNDGHFIRIEGQLFHNPLLHNQNRNDDKIDFSYFELTKQMFLNIRGIFKPLVENQICFSTDFSFDTLTKRTRCDEKERTGRVYNKIRDFHKELNHMSKEEIKNFNDIKININITFAGYPLNKTKQQNGTTKGEIVYYHGGAVNKDVYKKETLNENIQILSSFGRTGAYREDIGFSNFPKPQGISGGGVYRIIRTVDGFDRELIGIGHTYLPNKHLFIGTNIKYCLNIIKNNRLMPYNVYQQLTTMSDLLIKHLL